MQRLFYDVSKKVWQRVLPKGSKVLGRFLFYQTESTWFSRMVSPVYKEPLQNKQIKFKWERADHSSVPTWIKAHRHEFPWTYHSKELDLAYLEGHPYLSIKDGEKLIGFVKLGMGRVYIHDFDQIIRFPPGACFIYDSLIIPEYRGKRIIGAATSYIMSQLHRKDYRILWAHIADYNIASLRAFYRMGFLERAKIRYIRFYKYWLFVRDGRYPFRNLDSFIEEKSRV